MPSWVIDRVNDIGSVQNQLWLEVGKSFFHPLTDDEPLTMPTYAHDDGQDLSYDNDNFHHATETNLDGTTQWNTTWKPKAIEIKAAMKKQMKLKK